MNQHQPTNRPGTPSSETPPVPDIPPPPELGRPRDGAVANLLPSVDVVFPQVDGMVKWPPDTAITLLRSEVRYAYRAVAAAIECLARQQNDYMRMMNGEVLPSLTRSLLRAVEGSDEMSQGIQKLYEAQHGEGVDWQQGLLDDD